MVILHLVKMTAIFVQACTYCMLISMLGALCILCCLSCTTTLEIRPCHLHFAKEKIKA